MEPSSFAEALRNNDLNTKKNYIETNNYQITLADMTKLLLTSCIRDDDVIQYIISEYYHSGQLMNDMGVLF